MNFMIFQRIAHSMLMLLIGGVTIGLLHAHDLFLALLLAAATVVMGRRTYVRNRQQVSPYVIFFGVLLTGAFGTLVELWGVSGGHWIYHDLSDARQFPLWLPFGWMLAFLALYRIESDLSEQLKLSVRNRVIMIALLSALLPTWGEIIAINLGVWSYNWPLQIFGVPLLAIALLMTMHLGIYLLITMLCRFSGIRDALFSADLNSDQDIDKKAPQSPES